MPYYTIQKFFYKKLGWSNKSTIEAIKNNQIFIDGIASTSESKVFFYNRVVLNGVVVQEGLQLTYLLLYKPPNYECSTSTSVKNTIYDILPVQYSKLYTVGRLDKASEGLLLLTNDAKFYTRLTSPKFKVEKEYLVLVHKKIDVNSLETMKQGMVIKNRKTQPCKVELVNAYTFSIVLTEGINRQIRRMCYQLGYNVLELKRVRIHNIALPNTCLPGEYKELMRITL